MYVPHHKQTARNDTVDVMWLTWLVGGALVWRLSPIPTVFFTQWYAAQLEGENIGAAAALGDIEALICRQDHILQVFVCLLSLPCKLEYTRAVHYNLSNRFGGAQAVVGGFGKWWSVRLGEHVLLNTMMISRTMAAIFDWIIPTISPVRAVRIKIESE